jgi:hypothetical protein
MNPLKKVLDRLDVKMPRYNEYLLRGFMAEQISGAAAFVDIMFREAIKLFGGRIEYLGKRTMSPEHRAEYELGPRGGRGGCRVTSSDLILIEYIFSYAGREYPVPLYIPYLRNDVVMIEDTTYVLQRSIKEQAFSRISNGVTMKVIRQPIPFYCNKSYRLESLSDNWSSNESVPTTTIYNRKRTKQQKLPTETIIHYLLCKFGFIGTIAQFGLTPDDCAFVSSIGSDVDTFRYFAAKSSGQKSSKKKLLIDIFLKIRKDKLTDPLIVKLIASILYTLTGFQKHRLEDLYDPSGTGFRVLLGKIIFSNVTNELQNKNKIDTHITSVDSYLDPITQARLFSYGIHVDDIYGLLKYIFCEIDQLIRVPHTNLYASRIDYLEELLVETIVKSVYSSWYAAIQRLGGPDIDPRKLTEKEVGTRILRMRDDLITRIYDSKIVQKSPPAYGDNALVGWLIQKMRQSSQSKSGKVIGSPDHQFDPSVLVVESVIAFSKTNPGAAGSINPYLQITPTGGVIRSDYADEIDEVKKYFPF